VIRFLRRRKPTTGDSTVDIQNKKKE
jgi:hypothetical protein